MEDASRGLDIRFLEKIHRWFSDPSFFWSKDEDWLNSGEIIPVSNLTTTNDAIISRIGLLTTNLLKIKKIRAWEILAKKIWTK